MYSKPGMRLLCLLLFIQFQLLSQSIEIVNSSIDHGLMRNYGGQIDFFVVKNISDKPAYVFAETTEEHLEFDLPNKAISPGDMDFIKVICSPTKKGKFKYELSVFTPDDPKVIKTSISGNILSFQPNYTEICPSFKNPSRSQSLQLNCGITVIDAQNGTPIPSATVTMFQGSKERTYSTPANGQLQWLLRMGVYGLEISSAGYQPKGFNHYFGHNSPFIIVRLERDTNQLEEVPLVQERIEEIDQLVEVSKEVERTLETIQEEQEEPQTIEHPSFSYSEYKHNHLILLVDISQSMSKKERLVNVQIALDSIVELFRPEDYISIITYQSFTNVIADRVSAEEKDTLRKVIYRLEAKGSTKGEQAIQKAYNQAKDGYIKDGNNQIILLTDGGFKGLGKSSTRLFNYCRTQQLLNDINFTVLCYNPADDAAKMLEKLAEVNNGLFINLKDKTSAVRVLEDNIRENARRE